MKVLVAVKRVIDAYVKVRVKVDGSGIEENKMSMNPFDEIAVEEAIRLKEQGKATEVVVVSIGDKSTHETLRTALALGADRALCIETSESYEPLNIAKILHGVVKLEVPDCVILGKQAIDGDNNQTGQMLAALLGWPQAMFASELTIDDTTAIVTREIDGGLETIRFSLPAIISTDLRLNEPRYASLPNIMKAKRKPLAVKSIEELSVSLKSHSRIKSFQAPPPCQGGQLLTDVDALVEKLKNTDKVI